MPNRPNPSVVAAASSSTAEPGALVSGGWWAAATALITCLDELDAGFQSALNDPTFWAELKSYYPYMGSPQSISSSCCLFLDGRAGRTRLRRLVGCSDRGIPSSETSAPGSAVEEEAAATTDGLGRFGIFGGQYAPESGGWWAAATEASRATFRCVICEQ
jgi:hypothetical protein